MEIFTPVYKLVTAPVLPIIPCGMGLDIVGCIICQHQGALAILAGYWNRIHDRVYSLDRPIICRHQGAIVNMQGTAIAFECALTFDFRISFYFYKKAKGQWGRCNRCMAKHPATQTTTASLLSNIQFFCFVLENILLEFESFNLCDKILLWICIFLNVPVLLLLRTA